MSNSERATQHGLNSHEEGVRTAKKVLEDADEDEIQSLVLGIRYDSQHRDMTATSRAQQPESEDLFALLGDQVVYLAQKHDSHPAGIIKHLIHVVQSRDDTPEVAPNE